MEINETFPIIYNIDYCRTYCSAVKKINKNEYYEWKSKIL